MIRYPINTPKIAAFVVPAVDGEINLFLLIDCIIKPAILIEDAAMMIAIVLGILEIHKIRSASSSSENSFLYEKSKTPILKDNNIRMNQIMMSSGRLYALIMIYLN